MRKHRGIPSWRNKHVTLAAISPPRVARGRFVGGHQSGLAGCRSPPFFERGASSCSSQRQRQREHGAPFHDRVHLPSLPTWMIQCESLHGSVPQDSSKHFRCTFLDEME